MNNNVTSTYYRKCLHRFFDDMCENLLGWADFAIKHMERRGYNICYVDKIQGEILLPSGKNVFYECKYASVNDPNFLEDTWASSIKDEKHDILVLCTPLNYREFLLGNTDVAKYYTLYAVVHTEDN